jgi:hypothetical protein
MAFRHSGAFVLLTLVPFAQVHAVAPQLAIQHWTLVTADTAPDGCSRATSPSLTVLADTPVQYCFGVRNVGNVPLVAHDVVTDAFGRLYGMEPLTLQPGETAYRNHIDIAKEDRTVNVTWTARDVTPVYTYTSTTFNFVDIRSSGEFHSLFGNAADAVTLPFNISLYGATSNQISICGFGLISVDSHDTQCAEPGPVPTSRLPLSVMLFWDYLYAMPGSTAGHAIGVWYQVDGTAPHRRAIVQWQRDRAHSLSEGDGDGSGVDFELVLHEDDPGFEFEYLDTVFGRDNHAGDHGSSATVGLNYGATLAFTYPSLLSDGLALRWSPNTWNTVQATSSATVLARAPHIDVTGNLSAAQPPNTVVTHNISVGDGGPYPLDWHASGAQVNSTAHIPKMTRALAPDWHAPLLARADTATLHDGAAPATPPKAYGRVTSLDVNDERFVSVDLSTAQVTEVSSAYTTAVGAVQFGDASRLYALAGPFGDLATVDPANGALQIIAPIDVSVPTDPYLAQFGLGYDVTTGVTYLVADDYTNPDTLATCGPDAWLYRLHPDTGIAHPIGKIGTNICIKDIAVNANGEMFGVDSNANTLWAIDKTTGAGTMVGPLGYDVSAFPGMGLDFDLAHNVLYSAAWDTAKNPGPEISTIDTTTGASTSVGPILGGLSQYSQLVSLAIDNHMGGCVDPSTVSWLSMTPVSGSVPPGGQQTVSVHFDSTGLSPGHYAAVLCVFSNDPLHRFVTLPVQMDVSDEIFGNGFEVP